MHLQHSPGFAGDSLTEVEVPVSSGTIEGVDFFHHPAAEGYLPGIGPDDATCLLKVTLTPAPSGTNLSHPAAVGRNFRFHTFPNPSNIPAILPHPVFRSTSKILQKSCHKSAGGALGNLSCFP